MRIEAWSSYHYTVMATELDRPRVKSNGRGTLPSLGLHLSRSMFATGRQLSGVVLFRLGKPTNIRSLVVSVCGREAPSGAGLARAIRKPASFFHREQLLSGMDQPRFTSERFSQLWNTFLCRDTGRSLSAGEHTYPFSISLPGSLPPSYRGKAGKIDYVVTARVQFLLGRTLQVCTEVPVVFVPRAYTARPITFTYPEPGTAGHPSNVAVSADLADRAVALGGALQGRFIIENPTRTEIGRIVVSLDVCERVRAESVIDIQKRGVDSHSIVPEDSTAPRIEGEFILNVPDYAPPTVEGTAISVEWLLKLCLDTSPPLKIETHVKVYAPYKNGSLGEL